MQLLQKNAVVLVSPEELLTEMFTAQKNLNTIEIEAKLAQLKAETLRAARIIANQIDAGLNKTATGWLQNIDATALSQIHSEARLILEKNRTARPLLFGCRAAITGPPNTGKSTLLNCLAGRQKAIVTDIKGTTRDWLSAHCRIGPLAVELIDTAGLDERLAETPDNIIEKTSQQRSIEILQQADIVLLVLDNSEPMQQLDDRLIEAISGKKVVTILNKCDRPAMFDVGRLPECLTDTVQISAKESTGIDTLCVEIERIFGVTGFDPKTPICFTDRQKTLLQQLIKTDSAQRAASIISELLNGQMQGGPCYSAK